MKPSNLRQLNIPEEVASHNFPVVENLTMNEEWGFKAPQPSLRGLIATQGDIFRL
jgi:hypothetical protein